MLEVYKLGIKMQNYASPIYEYLLFCFYFMVESKPHIKIWYSQLYDSLYGIGTPKNSLSDVTIIVNYFTSKFVFWLGQNWVLFDLGGN